MSLKGKTAIVTGGGRDIGRATAIRLAQAGANVVINYHSSSEGAASAVAQIEAMGRSAIALQGDMTSEQEVGKLVTAAVDKFGKIDIVAHITGGLVARKLLPEMSVDHWQTVMDLNATSFLLVVRAVLPKMENSGSIVVTASQAARDGGGPGAIAYAAAKGAVVSMVRGMAKELGPGIRVNSVCPGMIDTDFHNTFTKPEVRTNVANATPLKREGKSEDVANLICYLASEDASFITGSNIDINGGTLFS
eukprot:GHVN01040219.1.p1 GENE.GHVN01040219.1~~GHVN01040219.1.p1  ORF type:complete len:249 (-),score=31.98 GHVN01040219.1:1041-1787(-)